MSPKPEPAHAPGKLPASPTKPPPAPWLQWLLALALVAVSVWSLTRSERAAAAPPVSYTDFYDLVEQGKVAKVTLSGQELSGTLKQEETVGGHKLKTFQSSLPQQEDRELLPLLRTQKVEVDVKTERTSFLSQ